GGAYTVLARKYRPSDFSGLIGQSAMVRVLTNAFALDRIPHALVLTGVRGIGKTTTARIIAKGLNCSSADGPTTAPCGICENCVAIAESRHVDVLEMDAASRTGIDDIREIIDSVAYRAARGRYKVYIVDEAHMLSKNAFNGLLKTLEEPPPHVKFILATTDIHKVPVTVLSRCMRFDLRRIDPETLTGHLAGICEAEGVAIEPEALALVARASEGSVRDSLSILDQAIAHGADARDAAEGSEEGARAVTAAGVRAMLGLAERGRVFDLFEKIMTGEAGGALTALQGLYADSADPHATLTEVAEICHLVTVVKIAPERLEDPSLPPADRERAQALAAELPMRPLSRAWQMLLKALDEVARAPSAISAAEMAVIRMAHVAELPSPEQLVAALTARDGPESPPPARGPDGGPAGGPTGGSGGGDRSVPNGGGARSAAGGSGGGPTALATARPAAERRAPAPRAERRAQSGSELSTFEEIAGFVRSKRDLKLLIEMELYLRPGAVQPGRIEVSLVEGAPTHLAGELKQKLQEWTRQTWVVTIADGHETPTLMERRIKAEEGVRAEALAHPLVQAALEAFPGAELKAVKTPEDLVIGAALQPAPDDLDPDELEDDDMLDLRDEDPGPSEQDAGGSWEPDREPKRDPG
ncbi:MAG: DNA polymerase III subunit gamma/tau, partial [Pseudomonadota bacterium]